MVTRSLAALSFHLVLVSGFGASSSAFAWDWQARPDADAIETLLRERLAAETDQGYVLHRYTRAEVEDFDLRSMEQISPSRWEAEVELLLDFGSQPAGVIGFEPQRRGGYRLVLEMRDGDLTLLRMTPIGRVLPLPAI